MITVISVVQSENVSRLWLANDQSFCKYLHLGTNNPRHQYSRSQLAWKQFCRKGDPGPGGEQVDHKPVMPSHHKKKVSSFLGWIRSVASRLREVIQVILNLYSSQTGHIWVFDQFWAPQCKKDPDGSIRVRQHRTTKMVKSLGHLSNGESLREMGLLTLEKRKFRGDLLNMSKYPMGQIWNSWSQILHGVTYWHNKKWWA